VAPPGGGGPGALGSLIDAGRSMTVPFPLPFDLQVKHA